MANSTKPPKGALITGLVLLVLSFGGCGAFAWGFSSIGSAISDAGDTRPLGSEIRFTSDNAVGAIVVASTGSLCSATDSAGADVTLEEPSWSVGSTTTENQETLDEIRFFDTREGETYSVICNGSDSTTTTSGGEFTVVRMPDFPGGLGGLLIALLGGPILGGILFLIGIILILVGLVSRSKWRKRNAAPGGPSGFDPHSGTVPPPPGSSLPPPPASTQPGAPAPGFQPGGGAPGAVPPAAPGAVPPPAPGGPPPGPVQQPPPPPPPPGPGQPPPPPASY